MRRSFVAAVAALALVAGPAAASTPDPDEPTFRTERVYFHCNGSTKVGNVSTFQGETPSWDTTAPSQSVQSGAGCGQADPTGAAGTAQENIYDAVWKGTFTGNVRNLTVEAHVIYAGAARAAGNFGALAKLSIDGATVLDGTPATSLVRVVPVRSSTGVSEAVMFSVEGLDKHIGPLEKGDGTREREFVLTLHAYYVDQNPFVAWVYDTTEVPSGITFNPATLETHVIPS